MYNELNQFISCTSLIIIAVSGRFIGETLNCRLTKLIESSMILKNVVFFIITYFTLQLLSLKPEHPIKYVKNSVIITFLFIFMNKLTLPFTLIAYGILFSTYVINNLVSYHEEHKNKQRVENLKTLQKRLYSILLVVIVIGVFFYYQEKKAAYTGKKWDTLTFLFGGVNQCKVMSS